MDRVRALLPYSVIPPRTPWRSWRARAAPVFALGFFAGVLSLGLTLAALG